MTEMNIEVTDVTVTHDLVEVETDTLQVSSTVPTSITIASAGAAGPAGPSGGAGPTGGEGPAGPATPVDYQGTGFPEGVVTATVGKTYRDNSATNGAILWIKATGTGNTGWKVIYGDTGWRDITSLIITAPATGTWSPGTLIIRRVNEQVSAHLSGAWINGNGETIVANNEYKLWLPTTGWARSIPVVATVRRGYPIATDLISSQTGYLSSTTSDRGNFRYTWDNGDANFRHLTFSAPGTALTTLNGLLTWTTNDVWPAALPGTAA